MTDLLPKRRFYDAIPPDAYAGLGKALRYAFRVSERASSAMYQKLLDALNRG